MLINQVARIDVERASSFLERTFEIEGRKVGDGLGKKFLRLSPGVVADPFYSPNDTWGSGE